MAKFTQVEIFPKIPLFPQKNNENTTLFIPLHHKK